MTDVQCKECDGLGWSACACLDQDGVPAADCEDCGGMGYNTESICDACDGSGGFDDEDVRTVLEP